jgi:hypothetical protein
LFGRAGRASTLGTSNPGRALPNRAGVPGQVRLACAALSCRVQRRGRAPGTGRHLTDGPSLLPRGAGLRGRRTQPPNPASSRDTKTRCGNRHPMPECGGASRLHIVTVAGARPPVDSPQCPRPGGRCFPETCHSSYLKGRIFRANRSFDAVECQPGHGPICRPARSECAAHLVSAQLRRCW